VQHLFLALVLSLVLTLVLTLLLTFALSLVLFRGRVLWLWAQVLGSWEHLHSMVVHRDIKPDNLLISDRRPPQGQSWVAWVAWWGGSVVGWKRGGVVAWWGGSVVAWKRGGVEAWWGGSVVGW